MPKSSCSEPGKTLPDDDQDPDFIYRWADEGYGGRYTIANGGQQKFGGWHVQGLHRFNDLRKANKKARKTPESRELEAGILGALKTVKKRLALTPAEEQTTKKPKLGLILGGNVAAINCFDTDSEDDDDQE